MWFKRFLFYVCMGFCLVAEPAPDAGIVVQDVEAKTGSSAGGSNFRSRTSRSTTTRSSSSRSRSSTSSSSFGSSSRSSSRTSRHVSDTYGYHNDSYHRRHDHFDRDDPYRHDESANRGKGKDLLSFMTPKVMIALTVLLLLALVVYYYTNRPTEYESGFSYPDGGEAMGAQPFVAASSHVPASVQQTAGAALLELAFVDPERTVQHALEHLARTADLSTPEGLRHFLGEVAILTRRQLNRIDHGALLTDTGSEHHIEGLYRQWVSSARSRFDRDILRRQGQQTYHAQQRNMSTSGLVDEDGDFEAHQYLVISMALAWGGGLGFPQQLNHKQELMAGLDAIDRLTTSDLLAFEVVWSPSAESDAMGKSDMLTSYPELSML